ncbi:hypothetical protein FRX31_017381 [Thalictrum thalictroides]|uniref:WRC domain-containing protein n=1 Tax=Thalictrum thalictroides TaxID=46969 RepID=A0A7J6W710_THATH|nr:hypothetical protein FRX31_017381 [Thalictrum thalictroides]
MEQNIHNEKRLFVDKFLPSDHQQCRRYGKSWRCPGIISPGKRYCEKHQLEQETYNEKNKKMRREHSWFLKKQALRADETQCRRSGKGWRCNEMTSPGKPYCNKHRLEMDIYNEKLRKKRREHRCLAGSGKNKHPSHHQQCNGMEITKQKEGNVLTSNPTSGSASIDKATQPSPSETTDSLWENITYSMDEESNANEADSPSDSAGQENIDQSPSTSDEEFLIPSKKVREGDAEATMSIKRCHTRGMSHKSCSDVDAQCLPSFPIIKDNRNVMEAESSKDIGLPKCNVQRQMERHVILSAQQMKEPFLGTKLLGVEGVENQSVKRKSERPKGSGRNQWSQSSESQCLGLSLQQKGTKDAANRDLTVVQIDSTPTVEHETLPLFLEKPNPPLNQGTEDKAINSDLATFHIDRAQLLFSTVEHQTNSLCLENSSLPLMLGYKENQLMSNEKITPKENCPQSSTEVTSSFDGDRDLHSSINITTNTYSTPVQHDEGPLPIDNQILPFVKSSHMWRSVESMAVLQLVPQHPHFRPLEKENEELREGIALGNMLSFANMMEKICKASLDDPRSMFENMLNALSDLEEFGFFVLPMQTLLVKLLKIKDDYNQLKDKSRTAEGKVIHGRHQLDVIQEPITQLTNELQVLMKEKELQGFKVARLHMEADVLKRKIQSTRLDFAGVVASPWK